MQLKRELSRLDLLLLAVGSIIGSGWLFGSLFTAQIAGPAAILSWVLGGFFIAVIALTIAEISTLFPVTGGSVSYTLLSHGRLCGAMFAWITWLWTMTLPAVEVQAVVQYSSNYIPNLYHTTEKTLTAKGLLFATSIMFLMCILNMVGVKLLAKTNKFIVFWKLVIPFVIAFVLMTYKTNPANLTSGGFAPYGLSGIFSGISNGGVAMSFFGFQVAIFVAGEAKNPQSSIPYSLFGSLLICTVLYVCLQYGFIVSLPPESLANGWKAISFTGDAGPFAGILVSLGFVFLVKVLYFDAVLSPLGTAMTHVAASSRILYSLSLQNHVPSFLSSLNRFSIPWTAILTNFIIGMLFFLPFQGWQEMVSFISAAIILSLVCGPICLPIYRKKFPNHPRSFKLPWSGTISFIAFYFCNLILSWTGWNTIYKLDIAIAVGFLMYFVSHAIKTGFKSHPINIASSLWLVLYLGLITILSYFSTFGGGTGAVNTEVDFIIVFAITALIYFLAQKTSLGHKETAEAYTALMNEKKQEEKSLVHV